MKLDPDTLVALAMTAAQRRPLINALPKAEQARIVESLRSLRARVQAARITSADIPGRDLPGQTEIPGNDRDTATLAGTLHRGEFRGVRVQATATHTPACPWAREVWPLTSRGDLVACTCGLTERLEGPIAAQVRGELWVRWLDMARDLARAEAEVLRREALQGTPAERKARRVADYKARQLTKLRAMTEEMDAIKRKHKL